MRRRIATPDELERAIRHCGLDGARTALGRYGLIPPIAGLSGITADSSTPAHTLLGGSPANPTLTTAFTPPNNSLIVLGISAAALGGTAAAVSSVSGGSLTWTKLTHAQQGANVIADLWCAVVSTSPGSMQASVTWNTTSPNTVPTQSGILAPLVLTGCATTQNGAVATPQTAASGATPSVHLTTTANGSLVIAQQSNFTSSSAPTMPAGQTDVFTSGAGTTTHEGTQFGNGYWMQTTGTGTGTVTPTASSGTVVTINDTAPTNLDIAMCAAEILAAGGAPAAGPHVLMLNWPHAMWRSAYR